MALDAGLRARDVGRLQLAVPRLLPARRVAVVVAVAEAVGAEVRRR